MAGYRPKQTPPKKATLNSVSSREFRSLHATVGRNCPYQIGTQIRKKTNGKNSTKQRMNKKKSKVLVCTKTIKNKNLAANKEVPGNPMVVKTFRKLRNCKLGA